MDTKFCSTCRQQKPYSEFDKDSRVKDGMRARCKVCRQDESKQDRAKHYQTRMKPSQDKWVAENKEHVQQYKTNYYRANIVKWIAHRLLPETQEAARKRTAQYYKDHPEWAKKKYLEYLSSGKTREWNQRRRARVNDAPVNDLTKEQWDEIKSRYGNRCAYCHIQSNRLTQDHVIPISKGGAHTASNIVPACKSCNSKKRSRLFWHFLV